MFNNKKSKVLVSYMLVCLMLILFPVQAFASTDIDLMQYRANVDRIQLYVTGLEEGQTAIGQIGRKEAQVEIGTEAVSVHTIILVDNSLSITTQNQKKIQDVISQYVQQKPENEVVSVAVYGENITYLLEKETDGQKIVDAMSQITYQNQDSYLTDILYEEMERLDSEQEYVRFVVATDGVDNKAIGYTKEELTKRLEEDNYPIYALGCIYKDNTSELENFFALARSTNAKYFLLDDYEEFTEVVNGLAESVSQVVLHVPDEYRDGSLQNVLLTFTGDSGSKEISCELRMPFQVEEIVVEETIESTVEETVVEETTVVETVEQPTVIETVEAPVEEAEGGIDIVTIGAVLLLVVAVVGLLLSKKGGKKKEKAEPKKKGKEKAKNVTPLSFDEPEDDERTVILGGGGYDSDVTMILDDRQSDYKVVLTDVNNASRVFSYPLIDNSVIIGRSKEAGAQLVINYKGSISKTHCKVSFMNGRFYVNDENSSNGTFVNGRRITGMTEFENGAIFKLGEFEATVMMEIME